jgi:hypothetical protein
MIEAIKSFARRLVVEGTRVFWTAVEAAAGFLAAYTVPDDLLDFLGAYETYVLGAIGVAVAALATFLKELARRRMGGTPDPDVPTPVRPDLDEPGV